MKNAKWCLPVLLMALLTPFTPQLDLAVSQHFFQNEHFASDGWAAFMFTYGIIPAYLALAISFLGLILSFCSDKWKKWRAPALCFIFTIAIGAGLIVHGVLKEHWGRPRPKQVIEFGGQQAFRPYYKPNFFHQPEPSKSFSCGHCSMGFCFFALILIGKRLQNSWLYYSGISLTLILGFSLSLARIAQGGHFLSDTLMTALIMWLTALTADWLFFKQKASISKTSIEYK